jgi:hypothetical protein
MTAAPAQRLRFSERVGGVLVAPVRTFARLAAGEARASDVAWLMLAWLLAGSLPQVVQALLLGRAWDVQTGAQALLMLVSHVLLADILGILVAGLLLSLFLPRGARGHGQAFDVAAYAWIPYLAVRLGGSLLYTALGRAPSPRAQTAVELAGLAWAVVAWACALWTARGRAEAAS